MADIRKLVDELIEKLGTDSPESAAIVMVKGDKSVAAAIRDKRSPFDHSNIRLAGVILELQAQALLFETNIAIDLKKNGKFQVVDATREKSAPVGGDTPSTEQREPVKDILALFEALFNGE